MKINSITLENFGPYFGVQKIELGVNPDSPIVLVHGDNMRGKTTLLKALVWGLYGRVSDHSGESIEDSSFANWDKRHSGVEFNVGVTIEFTDQGEEYTLKREYSCAQDSDNSNRVKISGTKLSLISASGNPVPREDIRERINAILHEEISELFLFDGETLSAFERKLRNPVLSSMAIKESIEKALGLSAINSIIRDLQSLKLRLSADRKEELKQEKTASNIVKDLDKKEDELIRKNNDLLEVRKMLEESSQRKAKLQPNIDASATLREKNERVIELREEVDRLKSNVDINKSFIQNILQKSYWIPINSKIQDRKIDLEDQIANISKKLSSINTDIVRESDLIQSIEDSSCVVCSQKISADLSADLMLKLEKLQKRDSDSKELIDANAALVVSQKEMRTFTDSTGDLERLIDLDAQIREDLLRIDSKLGSISDLRKILDETEVDFNQIENDYNKAVSGIEMASDAIPKLESQISTLNVEIKTLEDSLASLQKLDSPLRRKIEILDQLIAIYENSINEFSNRMRVEVEKVSSRIFKELTSEPLYKGLRINNNYYLDIIDKDDRVIQFRSAGAEQIVTMSLIGALVECSVKEAPVVIDTPLGRLDGKHRHKLLKWLPNFGNQVMLFVTDTEFREPEDRIELSQSIGREYELNRISATKTEIRKRSR